MTSKTGPIGAAIRAGAARIAALAGLTDGLIRQREAEIAAQLEAEMLRVESEDRRRRQLARARWENRQSEAYDQIAQVNWDAGALNAPWSDPCWTCYQPPADSPAVTRIGQIQVAQLRDHALHALVPFGSSLVVEAGAGQREAATRAICSYLLRLLLQAPPGRLRLSLMDTKGLGKELALFMGASDEAPEVTGKQIHTDARSIDACLAELTDQMDTVIQGYLRGQYASVEEYNRAVPEMSLPWRVAVALGFPEGYSPEAAQRLLRIAEQGRALGFLVVMLTDPAQPAPKGIAMADFGRSACRLRADGSGFLLQNGSGADLRVAVDAPPAPADFQRLLHQAAGSARSAQRVVVPLARIAPGPEGWWQGSSAEGLMAPIGGTGTGKPTLFQLGHGFPNRAHAMLGGQTGQGKSTLLHTLILSLAMTYSPEELELYLVDFKEGVEFKPYAAHQLPHARVVALQGDREFGLSVLKGLSQELLRRSDLFRSVGVSGLEQYRQAGHKLPRIVFVADEFQVLFQEDDIISERAQTELEDLVRRGRSVGIHVILSTQTLRGVKLRSSTRSQIAIRIALHCDAEDSAQILGEGNRGAVQLERPGQAIYNADGGKPEANREFQSAMVPAEQRTEYLRRLAEMARAGGFPARPPVVFEGGAAVSVEAEEHPIARLARAAAHPSLTAPPRFWLGEPVDLKPSTAAVLERVRGRNLLVVGKQEEQAVGMVAAGLVGLAAQHGPDGAVFYLVDGTTPSQGHETYLAALLESLPHQTHRFPARKAAEAVERVAAIVSERTADTAPPPPTRIYLIMLGLHRAVDLRRGGLGSRSDGADRFARILKEGPDVGVHVLVWADTTDGALQVVERRILGQEFGIRAALSVAAGEAGDLLGVRVSRIGPGRAVLMDDETGEPEKYRPYQKPSLAWIHAIGSQLTARGRAGEC
jgi:DNA segregation ATPase FtsK/SpoIIIE, S-DNA-T family